MNRRQEIAAWVFGVLLAVACLMHGTGEQDFTIGVVAPILIIGALTVFSLRTRRSEPPPLPKRSIAGGLLVLLGIALAARAAARFDDLETYLESRVETAEATANDLESRVADLDRKVGDLDQLLEDVILSR